MAYGDYTDLARGTTSDKLYRDKAFDIVKNPKYDGIKEVASMVYKYLKKNPLHLKVVVLILNKMNN